MFVAIEKHYKDIAEILLTYNVNVNAKTTYGETALIMAVRRGYVNIVYILLQKNAAVNVQAWDGYSALIEAASNGQKEIVQMLIDYDADVNDCMHHVRLLCRRARCSSIPIHVESTIGQL